MTKYNSEYILSPNRLNRVRTTQVSEYYRFDRPKKYGWIAEKAWQLLKKLGALKQKQETVETFHFTHQDSIKLTDYVMSAFDELFHERKSKDDFVLIIGDQDFYELFNTLIHRDNQCFQTTEVWNDDFGYTQKMTGYKVHVIRGMKGYALIPKIIIEEKRVINDRAISGKTPIPFDLPREGPRGDPVPYIRT